MSSKKEQFLKGRDKQFQLNAQQIIDMNKCLDLWKKIEDSFGEEIECLSGYRDPESNAKAGGAPSSNHLRCRAFDLKDADGRLASFCLFNLDKLKELGLWIENPNWTNTWVHFQIVPPASGKRVFVPNSKPQTRDFWDNKYDSKHD